MDARTKALDDRREPRVADGAASPLAIVRAWLRSRPHRHVLLRRAYRVIGIGIARGTPFSVGDSGSTYTADFGT